ncbi:MAG: tetratricopeptide repeat protein [Deltaproteobacteria bacterium]|nr:tetratricopeptide repeat protein [Deltaproteobacteria bacterium]
MKTIVNPTRLVLSPEFGPLLKQASNITVSDARLEYNRRIVSAALINISVPTSATLLKVITKASTLTKTGMITIGLVGGLVLWRHGGGLSSGDNSAKPTTPPPAVSTALAPDPTPKPIQPASDLNLEKTPKQITKKAQLERPRMPKMRQSGLSNRRANQMPPSAVAAQLKLFHQAQAKAKLQQYNEALKTLDVLERRYPQGSLEAEIIISRAEYLWLAGRYQDAANLIEKQINNPVVAARKAELWLTLGDVRQRQGSCKEAIIAYQRALGLGLRPADVKAAQKGLKRCTP